MRHVSHYKQRLRSRFAGFSLFELMLVLIIVAALIGVVYEVYLRASADSDSNNESQQLTTIVAGVHATFSAQSSYSGLSNSVLLNAEAFPQNMVSGTTVTNSFGGSVTVAPASITGSDDSFSITYNSVPQSECVSLTNGVADMFKIIDVDGTAVKTLSAPTVNVATLTSQCAGGAASNTLVFEGN